MGGGLRIDGAMASRPFSAADRLKPGRPGFYLAGLVLLALAYAVIFAMTGNAQPGKMALDVLANIVPVAIGALVIRTLWRGALADRGGLVTLAGHVFLAALFTVFWFWLLMILLAITSNGSPVVFSVAPFLGPAAAWQLYQGLLLYAVIAMAVHLEIAAEKNAAARGARDGVGTGAAPSARPFIKEGDDIRPLDPDRIVQIAGADDYAEVRTVSGTHMLRTTLAELERALGDGFMRVHRSHIVNIDRIARIEPAGGGRLSLHMEGGETVVASRAGAKAIRERLL